MNFVSYTIKAGDTLTKLASQFGTTVQAIASANGIADPNKISVGAQLSIPAANDTTQPTMDEVIITGNRPDFSDWLKPPKVYGLAALSALLLYLITEDEK
jgi:LysM repeat protein